MAESSRNNSKEGVSFREMITGSRFYYGAEIVTTRGLPAAGRRQSAAGAGPGLPGRSAHRLDLDHRQPRRDADAPAGLARRHGPRPGRQRRGLT